MTEAELDPELQGNGVGKLHGINQRGGVIIFAFQKYHCDSNVVGELEGQSLRVGNSKVAVQGPGGDFKGPNQGRAGAGQSQF